MKPIVLLLLFSALSFYGFAAIQVHIDKCANQAAKKKVTKNIAQLALKAVQAIPEKEAASPEDHVIGFWLFKF